MPASRPGPKSLRRPWFTPASTSAAGRESRVKAILYPGVFIGRDAVVGEASILYPRVTLYRRCLIGRRVVIHAGAVIGTDGFGFARPGQENLKIPQVGYVQIDDDVEIGANTTIDRGALGRTWIQRGVKIDNLVQIAHNVVIGEYSIVVAQVGISGKHTAGKRRHYRRSGGSRRPHPDRGSCHDRRRIGGPQGRLRGPIVAGTPHMPHGEWLKMEACRSKLPAMRETLAALQRRITALEEKTKKEPL